MAPTPITDDQLLDYANRASGKVVLITGAGAGIGKETAIHFAESGAKLVLGDINLTNVEAVAEQIRTSGGEALALKCDVTVWDELVDMYEKAMERFGSVDIVIANAGVSEVGNCCRPGPIPLDESGRPQKPGVTTIDVNVVGVLHTSWIALHVPAIMYATSKHAVLGLMRALDKTTFKPLNIRVSCIHPFYADTAIIGDFLRESFKESGVPLVPIGRIVGAIIHSATHPDPSTSGGSYYVPGPGSTFFIAREDFKAGVYEILDEQCNAMFK
ncbi:hypothetical protein V5O48_018788 [Marasmius crinis-equi]|uniref:Uncharacterized protein n=1 Tax=Marasmius crinis-equi TaxID=585013 RepID=A0ABR3EKA6_9AGAR